MDEMNLGPEFRDHVVHVLADRGASPFEATRYFRLPEAAQLAALPYLEDQSIPVRDLLADLEHRGE
jgi:hypothetical protein